MTPEIKSSTQSRTLEEKEQLDRYHQASLNGYANFVYLGQFADRLSQSIGVNDDVIKAFPDPDEVKRNANEKLHKITKLPQYYEHNGSEWDGDQGAPFPWQVYCQLNMPEQGITKGDFYASFESAEKYLVSNFPITRFFAALEYFGLYAPDQSKALLDSQKSIAALEKMVEELKAMIKDKLEEKDQKKKSSWSL